MFPIAEKNIHTGILIFLLGTFLQIQIEENAGGFSAFCVIQALSCIPFVFLSVQQRMNLAVVRLIYVLTGYLLFY